MQTNSRYDTMVPYLFAASLIALGLTHQLLFRFTGTVTGLRGISLWLGTVVVLLPALSVYLMYRAREFKLHRMWVVAAVLVGGTLLNLAASRLSSVGYSFLFTIYFLVMMNSLQFVRRDTVLSITKVMMALYLGNVLIGQLLYLTGVESDFLRDIFRYQIDPRDDSVRFIAFAEEPSYAAFIVCLTYFAYVRLCRAGKEPVNIVWGLIVLYQVLCFRSVYGYLLVMILFVVTYYRSVRRSLVILIPTVMLVLIVATNTGLLSDAGRLGRITDAMLRGRLFNPQELKAVDHSLFFRVGIFIEYWSTANPADPHFYVGHGAMTHKYALSSRYLGAIKQDVGSGNLVLLESNFFNGFLYDFGLVGMLLVAFVLWRLTTRRFFRAETLLLAMVFFNANYNTQFLWYIVIILAASHYYSEPIGSAENAARA
ncbi:MAG: hypothetical protein KKA42_15475 [candidate division Zixibacteria bacterium]|nr:hypothetical protein [candidate division Zixibacteria bacterium]